MSQNSLIEWTDHTFNPWWGCEKVSAGCKFCYAETRDHRWNKDDPHWGPNSPRKSMSEAYWLNPFKWDADAKKVGINAKVFCASMADVFEDNIQVIDWRARLFGIIEQTPNLTWQLLTKRPENILKFVPKHWALKGWPENVWVGTTVENQEAADKRIPILCKVPSKVRFLSCEPLIGPVDLTKIKSPFEGVIIPVLTIVDDFYPIDGYMAPINWVITGGESGNAKGVRPMHPDWPRLLRDQCTAAKVPFFFKQWGESIALSQVSDEFLERMNINVANGKQIKYTPLESEKLLKLGKNLTGAILDGREWKEFPDV